MIECRKSMVQEYQCQVVHNGIAFDACLSKELFFLWDQGITTTGCCCGKHSNDPIGFGFIGVIPEDIQKMKELGYVVRLNPMRPEDDDSFYPKTKL